MCVAGMQRENMTQDRLRSRADCIGNVHVICSVDQAASDLPQSDCQTVYACAEKTSECCDQLT